MPKKINKKRATHRTRKAAHGRKNGSGSGRKRSSRAKKETPTVIANSIFALTLKPKPSMDVIGKLGGETHRSYHEDTDDYEQMYEDLFMAYKAGVKLCTGEETFFNPLNEGWGIGESLSYLMRGFKNNILPKGFDFNIDRGNDGSYYFTIYKVIEFYEGWHGFDIRPVVVKLWKENKPLHDLFIVFLKSFMKKLNIPNWWNGGMGYAEYQLYELLHNWDEFSESDYPDPEQADEAEGEDNGQYSQACEDYLTYTDGEAKEYKELIEATRPQPVEWLIKKLKSFDKRNKIVQWMANACELMKEPYSIQDFEYHEMLEEAEGLEFNQQVTIIWDWDDYYTMQQADSIDSTAQGCGVHAPVITLGVTPVSKKIDIEWLVNGVKWPDKITALQKEYIGITSKLTKKKKK